MSLILTLKNVHENYILNNVTPLVRLLQKIVIILFTEDPIPETSPLQIFNIHSWYQKWSDIAANYFI